MKLKIRSIHEQDDASKECVFLDVVDDCDLDHYGLADTTSASGVTTSAWLRTVLPMGPHSVACSLSVTIKTAIRNRRF